MRQTLRKFLFTLVALLSLTSMTAEAAEPISLTEIVMTQYTDMGDGLGQYVMVLATGPATVDEDYGVYRTADDGYLMTVTLYGQSSEARYPKLPTGAYTMSNKAESGMWSNSPGYNAFIFYTKAEGTKSLLPTAGDLTVTEEAGKTVLNGTVTVDGENYTFSYDGRIGFQGEDADGKIFEEINTTFIGGTAIHRELYAGLSVMELQLWDGDPDMNGQINNGSIVKVRFLAPIVDYANGKFNSVPTGTYTVSTSGTSGTIIAGEDDGINLPTGSYASTTGGGLSLLGMIGDGEMTVSGGDGGVYDVAVDLLTKEGVAIIGKYKGTLEYIDLVGGGPEYTSTLTEDKVLTYPDIEEVRFVDHGNFYNKDLRVIEIQWTDTKEMKGTMVELLLPMAPAGTEIPAGSYKVSPIGTWSANTFTVGQLLGPYPIGTWGHYKLEKTPAGEIGILPFDMGPAFDGEILLTKVGDKYQVDLDVTDDTMPVPHTMKMTWTGKITYNKAIDGIDDLLIARPASSNGQIYDLHGIALGKDGQRLPAGVYIQGARKFFISK